jgi:hypothetical protein
LIINRTKNIGLTWKTNRNQVQNLKQFKLKKKHKTHLFFFTKRDQTQKTQEHKEHSKQAQRHYS